MGSKNEEKSKIIEWRNRIQEGIDLNEYYSKLLDDLEELNKKYEAFRLILDKERVLEEVRKAENEKVSIPLIHYSAKDCLCTKGVETTAGSRILKGYIPPFNATVIEKLNKNGFILIGKTNMDEFGFGSFSINSGFETPRNAFNPKLVAGGSSGGAAVATALIDYHISIAESTGGSISCPAAFNGVVGFTPTYGVISRWGLISYANSLDKIGVMAHYTRDVEIVFNHMKGRDGKDSILIDYDSVKKQAKSKLRIAIVESLLDNCNEIIVKSFWETIDKLRSNYDIEVSSIDIDILKYAIPAYYIISTSEASTNLAKYGGMRYGQQDKHYDSYFDEFFERHRPRFLGKEAKRRILLGTFARMAGYRNKYYMKALKIRRVIIEQYKKIFGDFDLIATPTMPILAPRIDKAKELSPIETYMLDFLTIPPNLAGMPHLSLPVRYDPLPIGIQFIADHFGEEILFDIGKKWEDLYEYKHPRDMIGEIK